MVSVTRWFQSAVDSNRQKEQFSDAFIRAVAAAAGYAVSKPSVDDDSIDWQIAATGGKGTTRSPRLELQLKCRTNLNVLADAFRLPLEEEFQRSSAGKCHGSKDIGIGYRSFDDIGLGNTHS